MKTSETRNIPYALALVIIASAYAPAAEYFSDNFETNNLDAWTSVQTGVNCSASTSVASKRTGSYGFEAADNSATDTATYSAYVEKTFSSSGEVYARFYVKLKAGFLGQLASGGWENVQIMKFGTDTGSCFIVLILGRLNGNTRFRLLHSPGWGSGPVYGIPPEEDVWYCFEIRGDAPSADTRVDWWVNGVEQEPFQSLDYSAAQKWEKIGVGLFAGTIPDYIFTAYFDDVVVSDGYSGPPSVSITSPYSGAEVMGTVDITAEINNSGPGGTAGVAFYVDGVFKSSDTSDPYSYGWNTQEVSDGDCTLTAKAYDSEGQEAEDEISVTVDNAAATLPAVSITAPAGGTSVSGSVDIAADASGTYGISGVEFYVDGVFKSTDTSLPYGYTWDSAEVSDGAHTLKATAFDTIGQRTPDAVCVIVRNSSTLPADEHIWLHVDGRYIRTSPYSFPPEDIWIGAGVCWPHVWADTVIDTDKTPMWPGGSFDPGAEYFKNNGCNLIRNCFSTLPYPLGWGQGFGGQELTVNDSIQHWIAPKVEALKAQEIYSILDEHQYIPCKYPSMTAGSADENLHYTEEDYQVWVDHWVEIADYFKNEPWVAGYEIMNEPYGHGTDTWWRESNLRIRWAQCIRAIRQIDTRHIVFLPSTFYTHLANMRPTWEPVSFLADEPYKQAAFTFHDYAEAWANYGWYDWFLPEIEYIQNTYEVPLYASELNAEQMVPEVWDLAKLKQWQADVIGYFRDYGIPWTLWPPLAYEGSGGYNYTGPLYTDVWVPLAEQYGSRTPSNVDAVPTKVVCELSPPGNMLATGSDTRTVLATLRDDAGYRSYTSSMPVTFTISGQGTWDDNTAGEKTVNAEAGVAAMAVKSAKLAGTILIGASAPGLTPGSLEISVVPGSPFSNVKVYPVPFNAAGPGGSLMFSDVPENSTVSIYTLDGKLVRQVEAQAGDYAEWDGKNSFLNGVKRGLYIYLIDDGNGNTRTGKIIIE